MFKYKKWFIFNLDDTNSRTTRLLHGLKLLSVDDFIIAHAMLVVDNYLMMPLPSHHCSLVMNLNSIEVTSIMYTTGEVRVCVLYN